MLENAGGGGNGGGGGSDGCGGNVGGRAGGGGGKAGRGGEQGPEDSASGFSIPVADVVAASPAAALVAAADMAGRRGFATVLGPTSTHAACCDGVRRHHVSSRTRRGASLATTRGAPSRSGAAMCSGTRSRRSRGHVGGGPREGGCGDPPSDALPFYLRATRSAMPSHTRGVSAPRVVQMKDIARIPPSKRHSHTHEEKQSPPPSPPSTWAHTRTRIAAQAEAVALIPSAVRGAGCAVGVPPGTRCRRSLVTSPATSPTSPSSASCQTPPHSPSENMADSRRRDGQADGAGPHPRLRRRRGQERWSGLLLVRRRRGPCPASRAGDLCRRRSRPRITQSFPPAPCFGRLLLFTWPLRGRL